MTQPITGKTQHAWKLLLEIGPTFNLAAHNLGLSLTKSKMAEPTEEELIHSKRLLGIRSQHSSEELGIHIN